MQNIANGTDNSQVIQQLQGQKKYPHPMSVQRFANRTNLYGHCRAFRHTGNNHAEREIEGQHLIQLALYRSCCPKATGGEVNAFLYNMNTHDPRYEIYSNSQITRAEQRLNLTTKRSSTTAYQALLPHIILKRNLFWNANYPVGIADCDPRNMIDIDEAGWSVDTCNRTSGKTVVGERCREVGPYSKTQKVTVLLGVSGDDQSPDRWLDRWREGGTTVTKFLDFIRSIIEEIGPGTPARRRVFVMDNLRSHQNNAIKAVIHGHGHRIVFRAPYYPVDGAIEYVFNVLHCALQLRLCSIRTTDDMETQIDNIVHSMEEFSCFFAHCGFRY